MPPLTTKQRLLSAQHRRAIQGTLPEQILEKATNEHHKREAFGFDPASSGPEDITKRIAYDKQKEHDMKLPKALDVIKKCNICIQSEAEQDQAVLLQSLQTQKITIEDINRVLKAKLPNGEYLVPFDTRDRQLLAAIYKILALQITEKSVLDKLEIQQKEQNQKDALILLRKIKRQGIAIPKEERDKLEQLVQMKPTLQQTPIVKTLYRSQLKEETLPIGGALPGRIQDIRKVIGQQLEFVNQKGEQITLPPVNRYTPPETTKQEFLPSTFKTVKMNFNKPNDHDELSYATLKQRPATPKKRDSSVNDIANLYSKGNINSAVSTNDTVKVNKGISSGSLFPENNLKAVVENGRSDVVNF